MMASTRSVTVDTDAIMRNILAIRGQRVLLDSDLAVLYQVATKALTRNSLGPVTPANSSFGGVRYSEDHFPDSLAVDRT
jgi:hypothetical protein